MKGKHHYLWRAVDQTGHVLDILLQSRRNRQAAKRFFCKLLKGLRYPPRVLITDKLKSYVAAKTHIMPGVEHRQHKGLNNRAELSHQPTRQRERQMRRFTSSGHAQRFLSAHGPINNVFRCQRNRMTAEQYRHMRRQAFSVWNEVTNVAKKTNP
ncbi:DDE-type integrase/transposase/recombinase [Undibacterium sp. RTI2.1]|uniref:DDE-type integrase/transposase/recombinase n=1 Tax=unclassified Undibacterium TaxID=2630295 RepID=UPI002AB3EE45|nr:MULTISPECIES: DDE-type integrase/transposase/recombinase [unclassified Undibacterium]MDY7536937.1 DDE-type integrase/transposase/recombinase [Undibacterium sp. 5I1]MEB0032747.1 DDE-type integrase/transposase/recombinase [Undibacterium sp. RTI2.1]MEB0117970.1 DDE-type integrase/transposase/recombinase [Undibacterium sp. RTI2.2]MEB0232751.1 DDE-type integrase/transposase/recombinase [Undibacterium sp. 10I3]MEB0258884.1 DDE-type integrase/transposase/recombinase [Undibacterium sp. 5I1]